MAIEISEKKLLISITDNETKMIIAWFGVIIVYKYTIEIKIKIKKLTLKLRHAQNLMHVSFMI